MYDNSLKTQAFIDWPGVVKPGTVIEHTITTLDVYPTIVEMAGATVPENAIVRGRSLMPLLKGEQVDNWSDDYYGEYSMINYCNAYMRCYRTPEWKLIRDFLNPDRDELYHIALDPQENINLIGDQREEVREVIRQLDQKIRDHMKEIHDPLLDQIHVDKYYYKK